MEENLLLPVLTGMVISYIIGSFPTSLLAGKILKGKSRKNFELARIKIDVTKSEIIEKIY